MRKIVISQHFSFSSLQLQVVFDLVKFTKKPGMHQDVDGYTRPACAKTLLGSGLSLVTSAIFEASGRPGAQKVLVILVSGNPTDDIRTPARYLRDHGVVIFAVVIGTKVDTSKIATIVSSPSVDRLLVADPAGINNQLIPLVQNIRQGKDNFCI